VASVGPADILDQSTHISASEFWSRSIYVSEAASAHRNCYRRHRYRWLTGVAPAGNALILVPQTFGRFCG
jgi:hypothetical protein